MPPVCPQCRKPVTRVDDYWSCPKHGEVTPVEEVDGAAASQAPRATKLFLSYARRDDFDPADPTSPLDPQRFDPAHSFLARLYRDLTARGFDVWFDRVSMPARNLTFHQEIRDAVASCDRLLLAVGTQAAGSDYVRQEWQFAWFAAEKIVTPILIRGRTDQPHADDITLLPDELKLLHCED